jgi:hypothetical protein
MRQQWLPLDGKCFPELREFLSAPFSASGSAAIDLAPHAGSFAPIPLRHPYAGRIAQ